MPAPYKGHNKGVPCKDKYIFTLPTSLPSPGTTWEEPKLLPGLSHLSSGFPGSSNSMKVLLGPAVTQEPNTEKAS